jgi:predicted RNA-binding protein with PIN domain
VGVHLIIDGYNVIRQSESLSKQERVSLEEGRHALITRLVAYKRVKALPVTVVFDGADGYHLSTRTESHAGIRVMYSPVGKTADHVIANMAKRYGEKAMVITSDRELAARAERAGATVLDSPEFEGRLEMALLMESGEAPEEDEPGRLSTKKKGPSKRPPRSQRRKARKLKKI